MTRLFALALCCVLPALLAADDRERRAKAALALSAKPAPVPAYVPDPPGTPYSSARFTQSIAVVNDRDSIRPVPISTLPDKRWHQPGGLEGVSGYTSERYRFVPEGKPVRVWVGNVEVENGIRTGHLKPDGTPEFFRQFNRSLQRSYPDGTRFDEVLRNAAGVVFEHRVRLKRDGRWLSEIIHRDESARPVGYTGLRVSCSSCHSSAGTGAYDAGLVPGGDGVMSDPLPWALWNADPEAGKK